MKNIKDVDLDEETFINRVNIFYINTFLYALVNNK